MAGPRSTIPPGFPPGFRALRRLGRGASSEVWLVRDPARTGPVALKRLSSQAAGDPRERRRFKLEYQTLRSLDHPAIVKAHDYHESPAPCYTLEYIPGRPPRGARTVGLAQVWRLGETLLEALAYLHRRGLVHRDLKPGNLRVTPDGRLKLLDFGLAQDKPRELTGEDPDPAGSAHYFSPEQIRGEGSDGRSDLYSAGVILYQLAAGRRPFAARGLGALLQAHRETPPPDPRGFNPDIAPAHAGFLLRLLGKNPAAQFPDAFAAAAALRACPRRIARAAAAAAAPARAPEPPPAPYIGNAPARAALRAACDRLARGGAPQGHFVRSPVRGGAPQGHFVRSPVRGGAPQGHFVRSPVRGGGGMTLVSGEAGAGKSRLLPEIEGWIAGRGVTLLHGAGREAGGMPLQLFQDLFAEFAGSPGGARRAGGARAAQRDAVLAAHFPALRDRLAMNAVLPSPLEPAAERARLFAAAGDFFAAALRRGPLLLWLEDLHWADPLSLELLAALQARTAGRAPLLMLGNFRPAGGELTAWLKRCRDAGARLLPLRPLSRTEAGRLARQRLGHPAEPGFIRRLMSRTGGNPFFISESLRDGGSVLPVSIEAALTRRLAGCPPQFALPAAALLGTEFRIAWWSEVSGLPEATLRPLADAAIGKELLLAGPPGHFRFQHGLLRAALLRELPASRRRRLHRSALAALERNAAGAGAPAELLTEHALAGGDPVKAVAYGLRAAGQLYRLYQWNEAQRLLERLQPVAAKARLISPENRLALDELHSRLLYGTRQYQELLPMLRRGIGIARRAGRTETEHALLIRQSDTLAIRGDLRAASRACERALALARGMRDRNVLVSTLLARGRIELTRGDLRRSLATLREARRFGRGGNLENRRLALSNLGMVYQTTGQLNKSLHCYNRALALAARIGRPGGTLNQLINLVDVHCDRGRLDQALACARKSLRSSGAVGNPGFTVMSHLNLVQCHLLHGDHAAARRELAETVRALRGLGHPKLRAVHLRLLAQLLFQEGRLTEASRGLDRFDALPEQNVFPVERLHGALCRAQVELARGRFIRAEAAAEAACRIARRGVPAQLPTALALRECARRLRGGRFRPHAFRALVRTAKRRGNLLSELTCRYFFSAALAASGDRAGASRLLRPAMRRARAAGFKALAARMLGLRDGSGPHPGPRRT